MSVRSWLAICVLISVAANAPVSSVTAQEVPVTVVGPEHDEQTLRVVSLLGSIAARIAYHEGDGVGELIDGAAMFAHADAQGLIPAEHQAEPEALIASLGSEQGWPVLKLNGMWFARESMRVLQVIEEEGGGLIVSTTHHDETGSQLTDRMRWWLVPDGAGGFRVADVELADSGLRLSTLYGLELLREAEPDAEQRTDYDHLIRAMSHWQFYENDRLEAALAEVDAQRLPDVLRRWCDAMHGDAAMQRGGLPNYRTALQHFAAAIRGEGLIPPMVYLLQSRALRYTGQLDEAREAVDRYEAAFAVHAPSLVERGHLSWYEGDTDQGIDHFFAAHDRSPQNGWLLYEVAFMVTDERAAEYNRRFAALEDPTDWFGEMLRMAERVGDLDSLRRVSSAFRLVSPDDPLLAEADAIMLRLEDE